MKINNLNCYRQLKNIFDKQSIYFENHRYFNELFYLKQCSNGLIVKNFLIIGIIVWFMSKILTKNSFMDLHHNLAISSLWISAVLFVALIVSSLILFICVDVLPIFKKINCQDLLSQNTQISGCKLNSIRKYLDNLKKFNLYASYLLLLSVIAIILFIMIADFNGETLNNIFMALIR